MFNFLGITAVLRGATRDHLKEQQYSRTMTNMVIQKTKIRHKENSWSLKRYPFRGSTNSFGQSVHDGRGTARFLSPMGMEILFSHWPRQSMTSPRRTMYKVKHAERQFIVVRHVEQDFPSHRRLSREPGEFLLKLDLPRPPRLISTLSYPLGKR